MRLTLILVLLFSLYVATEGLKCYSCDDVLKIPCKDISKVKTQECDSDNPICMQTTVVDDDMGKSIYTTRGCGRLEDEEQDKLGHCMDTGPTVRSMKKKFLSTVQGVHKGNKGMNVWVCTCNTTDVCNGGGGGFKMGQTTPGIMTIILIAASAGVIGWMGLITATNT